MHRLGAQIISTTHWKTRTQKSSRESEWERERERERDREFLGFHSCNQSTISKMQKLGFPSMKSLDQFKSFAGSATGTAKSFSFSSRPASDSISSGSFTNLKLTAGFDQKILVVWFIFSENWAHFVTCVVDLFVCREVGEGASFREDWSGNGGMISLSERACSLLCLCVRTFVFVCASISKSLFNNYSFLLYICNYFESNSNFVQKFNNFRTTSWRNRWIISAH